MSQKKYLLVVGGPTASGKTGFAIRLARHFDTHILSCDSRQFFREMSIGTAKPDAKELAAAPHHFIGNRSITQEYNVGAYEQEALATLKGLFQEKDIVILVGGSGLYIKALCEGLDQFPEVPLAIRNEVEDFYQQKGLAALQTAVQKADPEYFAEADQQNPHRLIRALSIYKASGQPFSSFRQKQSAARLFTPIYIQMHWPRQALYDRINQRVDIMIEQGLLEETRQLLHYRRHTALQTVGYQELFAFMDGQYNLQAAIELIKRNSRRYAKRQLTWMRRDGFWKHFHPGEWETALGYIHSAIKNDWQWREYKSPLPPDLSLHFNLEKKGNARVLTLYQNKELSAAILLRSFKRFELIERVSLLFNLPLDTIRYFLHEAICRCEDALIYTKLPIHLFSLIEEWGFSRTEEDQWPEKIKTSLEEQENHAVIGMREAL